MTNNDIKEALSRSYLATIVHRCGHKFGSFTFDHGVDLTIQEQGTRSVPGGGIRFLQSGRSIDCQLKATTEDQITVSTGVIKYSLNNKNYNDLIYRRDTNSKPIVLILFILPQDDSHWVECYQDRMISQKHLYWYSIPKSAQIATNENSKTTIEISDANVINLNTMPTLFDQIDALTSTP